MCYASKRSEERCPPDILASYREEVYATRSYKAFIRRKSRTADPVEADERARRALYFQKSLSGFKAAQAAQKAGQMRLF